MSENTPDVPGASPGEPALVDRRAANQRRRWWIGGGAVVAVAALVAVGIVVSRGGDADAAEGTGSSSGSSAASTPTQLVVGLTLEPTNLDIRTTSGVALDQVLIDNVYQGLVHRASDGTVGPGLATAWKVSDDALTYTFTLAKGATFSNGDALTSEDVVWSLEQLTKDKGVDAQLLASVASVKAPDDTTVVVTLTTPFPDLLWALSGRPGLVLDKDATNDRKSSAIGSGPYLLKEWKQGDSITLARNPTYWGADPAKVDTVVFRYLTDTNAAVNALNAGDLDVLAPIDALQKGQVTRKDVTLVQGAASDKFVLALNQSTGPLADLRVRQAVRTAIDHQAIIDARGGVDGLLGGPIPPGDPGYREIAPPAHDVAKAKALLAEAGYPDGLALTLTIPTFYGATWGDLLTSQLAQAGITLTVKQVEFSAWLQDVYTNHDFQLSIVDHAESHDIGAWADKTYYFTFNNAQVQDLVGRAKVAPTPKEADDLLAQAAQIVADQSAADWLVNFRTLTAVSAKVTGFPTDNINSRLDVTDVTVS